MLYKLNSRCFKAAPPQCRSLFYWINKMFNTVDEDRRKQLGPDRVCAEWILRNGGKVKWMGADEYENDYNNLPKEGTALRIREIDASEASVMAIGFEHFRGCESISKLILHKCNYLENDALAELHHLKESLIALQVSSCGNVSDSGLLHLIVLQKLKDLMLADLPDVKDKKGILTALRSALPKCAMKFDEANLIARDLNSP